MVMKAVLVVLSVLAVSAWAGQACTREGEKTPVPGRCSYYTFCENGTTTLQKCGFGKKFSNETLNCEWFWKVNCKDWASECEDGLLYNHPTSCRAYYSCYGNRLRVEYCPFLYSFNGEECQFLASCPKGDECVGEEIRAADCNSYDVCVKGKWVRKSCGFQRTFDFVAKKCVFGSCSKCDPGLKQTVDGSCHKYKECDGNEFVEKTCGLAKIFNSATGSCDWFFNVYCHPANNQCSGNYSLCADPTCKSYHVCENGKLKTTSCGFLEKYDQKKGSCVLLALYEDYSGYGQQCQEGTLQPDSDCSKFQKCVKGKWRTMSCPKYQAFDAHMKMCLFQDEAQCSETSCLENHVYVAKSDCYKYYKCINHKKVLTPCGVLRYFNRKTMQCVVYNPFSPPECDKFQCQEGVMRATSDKFVFEQCQNGEWSKRDCFTGFDSKTGPKCKDGARKSAENETEYYECENGLWRLQRCPPEAVRFDVESGKCEAKREKRDAGCAKGTKMFQDEAQCGETSCLENHVYVDKSDCYKYYKCINHKKVLTPCGVLQYFNPKTMQCVVYNPFSPPKCDKLQCQEGVMRATSDKFVFEQCQNGEWSKRDCFTGFDSKTGPKCKDGARKSAENETEYYECENGLWRLQRCPPEAVRFDVESGKCEAKREKRDAGCAKGTKMPLEGYCSKYLVCNLNGKFEERRCANGMTFDSVKKVCSPDAQCQKYEPVVNQCDRFKVNGRLGKCRMGDRFDYFKLECVDYAMAHCLKTCLNGTRKHHNDDCSKYYDCVKGEFVERSCGWLQKFDSASQKCAYFRYKCKYAPADCQNGFKKRGSDCRSYLECSDKHFEAKSCSFFKYFNTSTSSCDWFWRVSCEKRLFNVLALTSCSEGEKESVPGTCRLYRECVEGKWEDKMCSPCQNFNGEMKTCDYVWKNPCAKDVTDPTPPTAELPGSLPTGDPFSPTTPAPKVCAEGAVKPLKDNCKAYDLCKNNEWVVTKCWFWQKFDVPSNTCVVSYKAKCPTPFSY